MRQVRVDRDPFDAPSVGDPSTDPERRLTIEQTAALDRLRRLADEQVFGGAAPRCDGQR